MRRALATIAVVTAVTLGPATGVLAEDDAAGTPTTVAAPAATPTTVATPVAGNDEEDEGDKTGLWGLLGLLGLAGLMPRKRTETTGRVATSGATRVER